MSKKPIHSDDPSDLRSRAEDRLRADETKPQGSLSSDESKRLLHELRVHRIELEMQNEELRRSQRELEASRARYLDLYDLAPVGYFTVSENGLILEANITGATLLGLGRDDLINQPLAQFIQPEDQDIYYLHRKKLLATRSPQSCELRLVRNDAARFWARFETTATRNEEGGSPVCRVVVSDITNRKQADDSLRQHEERLNFALEVSSTGAWDLDLVNHTAYRSLRHDQIFGYESLLPEWSYELFREHVLPEDRKAVDQKFQNAVASGGDWSFECRIRRSDGQIRWILAAGRHRADASGKPTRIAGIVQDITERKSREREVERLNRLYAALSTLNQILVHIKSREELFGEVCRIATQDAGFGLAWIGWVEVGTHRVIPVARGGDGQDYLDEIEVYVDDRPKGRGPTGSCIREDKIHIVHDFLGTPRTAPWHTAAAKRGFRTAVSLPIHLQGMAVGALSVYDCEPNIIQEKEIALLAEAAAAISTALDRLAQDVQRKQAEEALAESNRFSQQVIAGAQEGVIVYGPDLRYQVWNPYMERLTGLKASEVIGRHPLDLFPFLLESGVISKLEQCLSEGTCNASEFPFHVPSSGYAGWAANTQAPLRNLRGEIIGVIGTVHDITEKKRAEETLLVAKEAAEAANRAKSEFLANMSHELRTPMTAITGYSDILMMSPDFSPAERQEFLEGIQRNAQALLRLIDDILDLSRIEADRLPVEKLDFPLQEMIDDVLSSVQTQAGRKGLSLDVDYQFPMPKSIRTDRARLRQILLNLVGNAVKFTEHGGIRISVRCLREANGTGRMQFAVTDSGIGIPRDKINDIFRPFVQVDGSLTRRYGGTGLGLGISQRLAKALGGNIEVVSQLGQGSTFTVTIDADSLTVTRMAEPVQVEKGKVEPAHSQQATTLQGRVLFAEDFSDAQHVIRYHLQGMGVEVDMADDGRIACELAEQSKAAGHPYDLILMDIQMPVMDGYKATRWLRERGWQGPIVALTAFAMVGDREKCVSAGCDDYLTKPVAPQGLKDVVTRYLSASADKAAAQRTGAAEASPAIALPSKDETAITNE